MIKLIKEMFNKKEEKKEEDNKKEEQIQQVNTKKMKVVIYRFISDDLVAQVGSPIIAEERNDGNNNLIVIEEKKNFKEDFNFSVERVYEVMNFSLKLQNKTNTEKAEVIRKKIKLQEELLIEIDEDDSLNAKYNYQDEDLKLRQLKIFYDSLRKEKKGNYMRLGEGGIRQYEFVSVDGILYPYFFGSKFFRVYPDLVVKKKIFNHENTIFKNEHQALMGNMLNWIMVIILALGITLCTLGGVMTYKAYVKSADMEQTINNGAIQCVNTLGTITKNYGGIINDYLEVKQSELDKTKETNINNEDNNIINNDLIIDPRQIIN